MKVGDRIKIINITNAFISDRFKSDASEGLLITRVCLNIISVTHIRSGNTWIHSLIEGEKVIHMDRKEKLERLLK